MANGGYVTPWARGGRASAVRTEALEFLKGVLGEFAAGREKDFKENRLCTFSSDARNLVKLAACQEWITQVCMGRADIDEADGEAAILSAYCEVVSISFRRLDEAYEAWVAQRLEKQLGFRTDAVGIAVPAGRLTEDVLKPMARFFLESLRCLRSNPNLFAVNAGRKELVIRTFGWSPGHDDLDVFISLLIVRQAKGRYLPNAFVYSPLAYFLRSEVLASVVEVRRWLCERCGKEYLEPRVGHQCPECRGTLVCREAVYLLSEAHPDEHLDDLSGSREKHDPQVIVEHRDSCSRAWEIAIARALELWTAVIQRNGKNPLKTAVLLSLAGLERVPEPEALACPKTEWLRKILTHFLERSLTGNVEEQRARFLLASLSRPSGSDSSLALSTNNFRTIICRFGQELLGGD